MFRSNDLDAPENPSVQRKGNGDGQIDPDLAAESVPKHSSLDGLTEEDLAELRPSLPGVELTTLVPFDTIAVRTLNTDYRIFLLDPRTGRALLERCRQSTEAVEVMVLGSIFGGSVLRPGWIGVGLMLEAWADNGYIRTSPVQSICIEHQI